jgi:hypothetical protein
MIYLALDYQRNPVFGSVYVFRNTRSAHSEARLACDSRRRLAALNVLTTIFRPPPLPTGFLFVTHWAESEE